MPISIGGLSSAAIQKALKPFHKLSKNSGMDLSDKAVDRFVESEALTEKKLAKLSNKQAAKTKHANYHSTTQSRKSPWKNGLKDTIKSSQEMLRDNFEFLQTHYLDNLLDSAILSDLHNTVKALKNIPTPSVDYLSAKMEALGSIYSPTQRLSQAIAAGDFEGAALLAKELPRSAVKTIFTRESRNGNITGIKGILEFIPDLAQDKGFIWRHFIQDGVSIGNTDMMEALFKYLPAEKQTATAMEKAYKKINKSLAEPIKEKARAAIKALPQNNVFIQKSGDSL